MNLTDDAWEKLFSKYDILGNIAKYGSFTISAPQIKEFREPRLMTKFDHQENLPQLFKDNNLAILPITRGDYLISSFSAYEPIETIDDAIVKKVSVPSYLQSLIPTYLVSESIALNCAEASLILDDFLEDANLQSTVSGRMGSDAFDFNINTNLGIKNISVKNSQLEIDAAYEGVNYLSIIEAKHDISCTDFLVRQLYYPYRLWQDRVTKLVKPIFFMYSNGEFRLYEYQFLDKYNYNSLQLVKKQKYVLTTGIKINTIEQILKTVTIVAEPEISFPQADSMVRIINLIELLFNSNLSRNEITSTYDFDVRQTNYYTDAGRYLGFIDKFIDNKEVYYCLTSRGKKLMKMNYSDKQLCIVSSILEHKVFNDVLRLTFLYGEIPDKATIVNIMRQDGIFNVSSDSTLFRRTSTIRGWINWIFSICEGDY